MNRLLPTALCSLLAAGCGVAPEAQLDDGVRHSNASFSFDTSRLTPIPAGTIPAVRLPLAAYDRTAVQGALIQTEEAFSPTISVGGREEFDSNSFSYSTDRSRGMVLAVNKLPERAPIPQDESLLQRNALTRLEGWGVGSGEIGEVWQRRLVGTAEDSGRVGATARVAYKTFVNRAILGVPVSGHRAVVTHGLDGSFRRVLGKWPALAASGHLLHTRLTTTDIINRATTALTAAGYTDGVIRLSYKLMATELTNGEAVLKLVVAARTSTARATGPDEPFEVDVDVDAIE